MGYFTYRLFKDVAPDRLIRQVKANLVLYEPNTVGRQATVEVFGMGCSAILMGTQHHEASVLMPVGYQFGGIWMDVRYQDGDWWDLTIYEDVHHRVSHSVNPWAHEERYRYNQAHIDLRIRRVCELWPDQADRIRPYLLPWGMPVRRFGWTRLVARGGKACPTDTYGYGDADQIHDFIRIFGIPPNSPVATVYADERPV